MRSIIVAKKTWLWLGPLFVIVGAALWGTETYFRVYLNSQFDPEILVFHEHLFCILFTFPFAAPAFRNLKKIPLRSWIYLLLSGIVGSAIGTTFFTMSLKVLNPSVANILLNFQPIVSIVFAQLLLQEKLGRGFFIWAVIALIAGLTIAGNGFSLSQLTVNMGLIYISITALAWGFSTVAGRGAMKEMPLQVATLCRFIVGAVTLFVSLNVKGKFTSELLRWNLLLEKEVLKNFLWLSVVAGVIPLYFYFKGLSKTSASVGGFCELTQTFSALILTWGIMGHPLTISQLMAGLLLLVAVYMINLNYAKANSRTH